MKYLSHYESPVGHLLLADENEHLVGLWIEGQKYYPCLYDRDIEVNDTPVLNKTKSWLDRYFSNQKPAISQLELSPEGSEFRKLVWEILCEIPYGETTTYGKIAEEAARRTGKERISAQAVGGAVGHNPISIIIPCHRVIGSDGSLTGYAAGTDKKAWLLHHEGVDIK